MRAAVGLLVAAAVFWVVLSVTRGPATCATKWDPIDPKELAATQPTVEKDANAEALLWEIRVQDQLTTAYDSQTNFFHHVRIKIFTDRGREAQSRVDLQHDDIVHIKDVEARAVRRDGSFTEITKADVFERTLAKAGGFKVKATSFALPSVETGGIVEYRWTEVRDHSDSNNLRLLFSRDVPVRLVRYQFVPLRIAGHTLQGLPFQTNPTLKLTSEKGFSVVSMENVPARREEPHAPSVWNTQPWMLIYYGAIEPLAPDEYWLRIGQSLDDRAHETMSPTSGIRRATESLALGTGSLDQKVAALMTLCQAKVKRLDVDTATDADRKGFNFNRSPTAALSAGRGTWFDVLGLFVAMARAAGLDARLARLSSRDDPTFDRSLMLSQFLWHSVAAVRDGERWRFVDPMSDHAPTGHLGWAAETVPALIGDKDSQVWATTPASPPEWSLHSRTAAFRLSEDGTLEGDVTTEFDGHTGMVLKEQDDHLAPAERETAVKDALTSRLPGSEVTGVGVDNVTDPDKPYIARYHLKVPGYAQRTGSRLFIQPAVFQKGIPPVFAAAERRFPIFFEYAWKEVDRVRIELPAGYRLESPDAPAPVALPPAGGYTMTLTTTPDGSVVEMTRKFFFGGGQRLQFPVDVYVSLKQFFDGVAKADAHTLTLRRAAGASGRPQ
jgi:transglutaminase-like putative cysteine protease